MYVWGQGDEGGVIIGIGIVGQGGIVQCEDVVVDQFDLFCYVMVVLCVFMYCWGQLVFVEELGDGQF